MLQGGGRLGLMFLDYVQEARMSQKVQKTEEEWREQLTPEQYRVTREKGTELPFTGEYWDTNEKGSYHCVCCGVELFESDTKFESGCGWPSFFKPSTAENIETEVDRSFMMERMEVHCSG